MKVGDVMVREVVTIPVTATYGDAVNILRESKISGAPVVDTDRQVVGMLSEKDLFRVLYPRYNSYYEDPANYLDFEHRENKITEVRLHLIKDFISLDVVVVEETTPIMKAGALMLARGIHRLPVVRGGSLVGLVTRRHIFRRVLDQHLPEASLD
jgi:CBS domain-containing protein